MKKLLMMTMALGVSTAVFAEECAYTAAQKAVRDAEIVTDLMATLPTNIKLNATYSCGGTLGQLAILRGNPDNLRYLLDLGLNPNAEVSLMEQPIPGAPTTIPLPLYAAYYAPASSVIDTLIEYKANFRVKDKAGHDVFWYFEQNPVLRNSYLTKKGYEGILPLHERIRLAREKALKEQAAAEAEAANNQRLVPVKNAD